MSSYHEPVLKDEVLQYLNAKEEGLIVDGTLGDGGHTELLLQSTGPGLKVLAIDRDPNALSRAKKRLASFADRVIFHHGRFGDLQTILNEIGIQGKIDGLLLDIGVSSRQLDLGERGFSFREDGPLDMRMDPTTGITAAELLETLSDKELESVIKNYGEERYYRRVVRAIRSAQAIHPIQTTLQLSKILCSVVPKSRPARIHPATRTFQALRIAVNSELEQLKSALKDSIGVLSAGARIVVISFHSLEDRIVKTFFREEAISCICPPKIAICVCDKESTLKVITRRSVVPTEEEVGRNPRASSSRLRAAERV
jgi:16S rRNA (cytosine1402-N4)-methyltransferase